MRSDTPARQPSVFFSSGRCNGDACHHLSCDDAVPVRGDQSWHSEEKTKMKIPDWFKPSLWGTAAGAIAMATVFTKLQTETSSYSRSDMVMKGGLGDRGK
jgi:hypothetical protein